jgi:predicted extracellular nuclease
MLGDFNAYAMEDPIRARVGTGGVGIPRFTVIDVSLLKSRVVVSIVSPPSPL